MTTPLHHAHESASNTVRDGVVHYEPRALRTFTPTQAVLAKSAGVFHWTPEGRRLYDFTSGVLVSNLGHNPKRWMERFVQYLGWPAPGQAFGSDEVEGYFGALPLPAYNAVTPLEVE